MAQWTMKQIANACDYALNSATLTKNEISSVCKDVIQYGAKAICVTSGWVKFTVEQLKDSNVLTSSYIGFPLGSIHPKIKIAEAKIAVENGAQEIDVVISIGRMKERDYAYIQDELDSLRQAISIPIKVIIESVYLDDDDKIKICEIVKKSNIDCISTSTGYASGGATISDVSLIRQCLGNKIGVKATGYISTLNDLTTMLEAGANRVETSSFYKIMHEAELAKLPIE